MLKRNKHQSTRSRKSGVKRVQTSKASRKASFHDELLWAAYEGGDPYIGFMIQAGLAPQEATKETHKDIRNRCKSVVLGTNYGMSAYGVAQAAAESLNLAQAAGIDLRLAYEALESSTACAPKLRYRKPLYLDEQAHQVMFTLG